MLSFSYLKTCLILKAVTCQERPCLGRKIWPSVAALMPQVQKEKKENE